jgi:hypothetical protein
VRADNQRFGTLIERGTFLATSVNPNWNAQLNPLAASLPQHFFVSVTCWPDIQDQDKAMLSWPGDKWELRSTFGALAHFQIGRAYAVQGDTVKAPNRLLGFPHALERCRPRHPILKQAKAEYAKLQ